ncbi:hypothetical protein [Amycolatopsis sp. GM8]|uniref:hypothetical protein n=1 Tax=Amycolatopsis sp. GM8 TaxID=2896530 RepID=UPI001F2EED60|nr:hypothetical protein [Amycolatopsis sp. GM8]
MPADWSQQRHWAEIEVGQQIPSLDFPLTIHRLVVHAGANLDFAPMHHNPEVARAHGAPDVYANNVFVQGMWERAVREFIGLAGVIKKIGPLRMTSFALAGTTARVTGQVARKWRRDAEHFVEFTMESTAADVVTARGAIVATLPA